MPPTWAVADSGGPERASPPIRREPRGCADPNLVGVAVCRCQPRPSERLDACVCNRKLVLWVGSGILLRRACPGCSTCARAWVRPTVQGLDPRFASAFWPARAGLWSSRPHGASFFGGSILRRQREIHDAVRRWRRVRASRPVITVPSTGRRRPCWRRGAFPRRRPRAQVAAYRPCLSKGAQPRGG